MPLRIVEGVRRVVVRRDDEEDDQVVIADVFEGVLRLGRDEDELAGLDDAPLALDGDGACALQEGEDLIGAVVATELGRNGTDVALVYRRSRAEAEETAGAVRGLGARAAVVQADLRDPDDCGRAVEDTVAALGRLDILVNMASVYHARKLEDVSVADWDEQMAVDLRAAWLCARAAIPHMRRQGGGRIVNFADWVAASRRPRWDVIEA